MKMNREIEKMKEEHWDIIAKKLNKEELSAEEKSQFDILATDEDVQRIIRESEKTLEKTDLFLSLKTYNTDKAWSKVSGQMNDLKKRQLNTRWIYRVAAVVLILVTAGFATWRFTLQDKVTYAEVITSETDFSNPEVVLPDGTKVKLNHGSKLVYPDKFVGDSREVNLTGEAFFDVTPNAEKPFIIKTNEASVKVLGTSFNVYAYKNASTVEVVVETGKVELSDNKKSSTEENGKILLMPGQKGILNKSNGNLLMENNFHSNELSWLTHEIRFEFTSLEDAFNTLQRIYNIEITIEPDVDMGNQLNATFNKQNIDHIMNVIAMTMNLKSEKQGNNKYIIQNNK